MKKIKIAGFILFLFIPSIIIYFSTQSLVEISGNSINKVEPDGNHIVSMVITESNFKNGRCYETDKTICIKNTVTKDVYCGSAYLNSESINTTGLGNTVKDVFYYDVENMVIVLFTSLLLGISAIVNIIIFIMLFKKITNKTNLKED